MNTKKIIFSLGYIALGILAVSFLWRSAFLLSFVLVVMAFIRHRVFPIKREFLWLVFVGILGATGEGLIMLSGAWSYAEPQIFNMPLWLPFLWGLTGPTAVTLYQGLTDK